MIREQKTGTRKTIKALEFLANICGAVRITTIASWGDGWVRATASGCAGEGDTIGEAVANLVRALDERALRRVKREQKQKGGE